jgi:integrase
MAAWLQWYEASGAARGTIRVRKSHLARLALVMDPLDATEADLVHFMSGQRLAPESRKSYHASLRSFYRFALARGLIDEDPTRGLRVVRVPRSMPRPIPEPVLRQAIHDADEETTLMLLLGAYAGLRRAEIAAVKSDDLEGLTLIVRGKGGVVRRVPVHPTLGGRLARLRGYAFPGRWGGHVTPSYVSDRMERVLPHPYTCHSLRHRFATQVYRSTHDLRAVQELLGHSKPETSARYTLMDEERLTAAVLAVA